tara:strand:- start:551 stop:1384 length:834 start_codon:yes stop_codon:yes gene_type:complete
MIERTASAREAGLDSLFVGDHHVTASTYYQNNVILARMLAEWGSKPFGALYLLPLWHPVLLAEQIGTLASLSEGPFIMQCGLGDEPQGVRMGIDLSKRVGMFTASLNVLRQLWAGESVSEGRYWGIDQARISPIPPETVEVWVGATADRAIRRTARMGDAWLASPGLTLSSAADGITLYHRYCEELDRTPTASAIRRDMYVGESAEEAVRTMSPYIDKGYRGIDPEALLIGSIAQVSEQLSTLQMLGYTDVIVRNISQDQSQCLASIERLSEVRDQL